MTNPDPASDGASLDAWAARLRSEVDLLRAEVEDRQKALGRAEEKLRLVARLRELDATTESAQESFSLRHPTPAVVETTDAREELEDAVEDLLSQAGQPLHISEIRQKLIELGIPIPGKGDDANIIVRLRKANARFTRTARGTYALSAWGLPSLDNGRSTRRRAIKKTSR